MNHEEQHIVDALCKLAEQMDIKCVLQVGAQDGYECDSIRKATGARAIAIEANKDCKPYSPELEWYNEVIGEFNGDTKFYIYNDIGLSGKLPRRIKDERALNITQIRLDSFCRQHTIQPDMLIIDTEGTTMEVLEGAGNILDSIRLIYAECQIKDFRPGVSLLSKVDSFLASHGFKQRDGEPSYEVEVQGNYTWVK